MDTISHFAVTCRYCKAPIPLTEYDSGVVYKLADSFFARHNTNRLCNGSAKYFFYDLDRLDLPPINGLTPQLDFAERILPRY